MNLEVLLPLKTRIANRIEQYSFCIALNNRQVIPGYESFELFINIECGSYEKRNLTNPEFYRIHQEQPQWVKLLVPTIDNIDLPGEVCIHNSIHAKHAIHVKDNYFEAGDWPDRAIFLMRYPCRLYFKSRPHLCDTFYNQTFQAINADGKIEEWTHTPLVLLGGDDDGVGEGDCFGHVITPHHDPWPCDRAIQPQDQMINKTSECTVEQWLDKPRFLLNNLGIYRKKFYKYEILY